MFGRKARHNALLLCFLVQEQWGGIELAKTAGARSIYPQLGRLERDGWIIGEWVESEVDPELPPRRLYSATELGREEIKKLLQLGRRMGSSQPFRMKN